MHNKVNLRSIPLLHFQNRPEPPGHGLADARIIGKNGVGGKHADEGKHCFTFETGFFRSYIVGGKDFS